MSQTRPSPPEVIVVTGGRTFNDYAFVRAVMDQLEPSLRLVIHGNAKGLDTMVEKWCNDHGVHTAKVDANWEFFGNRAGSIRNRVMLEMLKPQGAVVFPGGKGTAHMRRICKDVIQIWEPPYEP